MSELNAVYPYLLPCFFIAAFLHSSIGLAGGSSYTAFMAAFGVPLPLIPGISLSLNSLVSSVGAWNFIRQRHFYISLWWPFQLGALPTVYWGARTELPALWFYSILLFTLILTTIRMGRSSEFSFQIHLDTHERIFISVLIGMVLGFLSGSIGIGGGIYLVPCILLLGIGTAKHAAAVAVVFIWVNSVVGLTTKAGIGALQLAWLWPALLTVTLGGTLGSLCGAKYWPEQRLQRMLLMVLVIASLLLMRKIWMLL